MAEAPVGLFASIAPYTLRARPLAAETASELTLHYFAMKGRAEVIRLLLEEAAVAYDTRVWFIGPAWKEFKQEADGPALGMLPMLESGLLPTPLVQSAAIVRFLAAQFGLDGRSAAEKAQVDAFFETSLELKDYKSELRLPETERGTLESLQSQKTGNQRWQKLTQILTALDARVAGRTFFVGDALTYADLGIFNTLNYLEAVQPGVLQALGFCQLHAFRAGMAARPRLAAYLESERCFPFTELEILTPGFQQNGQPMGLKYATPLKLGQY